MTMILDARAQVDGVDGLTDLLESVDFDDMLHNFAARRSSFEEILNNFATAGTPVSSALPSSCIRLILAQPSYKLYTILYF